LNPSALYGLFALPLLLIPYLMRRKPHRYIFSSLYMFTALGVNPSARPLKRLRLPLIFFLQLLLLALMVLALSEPVFTTRPAQGEYHQRQKQQLQEENERQTQALKRTRARINAQRSEHIQAREDVTTRLSAHKVRNQKKGQSEKPVKRAGIEKFHLLEQPDGR
ncbi:MAG TPA: BatA domain-containing protein, partial [Candidatus Binatia bacterium]|nr:BatA domain-containing protein [Candidatus Binatia bacterium]